MPTLCAGFLDSASALVEAAKRVAALAIVDASLAIPRARPLCDAALGALALQPSSGAQFMHYRPSHHASALVILCHPSGAPSMCRTLAKAWEDGLRDAGVEVQSIDLESAPQWGIRSAEELRAALTGRDPAESVPPEVRHLQELVEASQFLVFVHPIFWFEVPSQLKGFQESVLSSGFAFRKLPSHWLLNRAAGVIENVPVVRTLMRRYAAYGLLRDKQVYITQTQGGPRAGMGIFGHGATSLESSLQFCGAHLRAVDVLAELDDYSKEQLAEQVLPRIQRNIQRHCCEIAAAIAAAPKPMRALEGADKPAANAIAA
mmetsp:Transcript_24758/g.71252  ORF Transcript_24758/g.71252 Transcript_24758/m.71252 type:complete len:317 (+) Transcript_24758:67-1017(+)